MVQYDQTSFNGQGVRIYGRTGETIVIDNLYVRESVGYEEPDITNLAYSNNSLDVSGDITSTAYSIGVGGGKMFIAETGEIHQYTLNSSNVSLSSYDNVSYTDAGERFWQFNDDGDKLISTNASTETYLMHSLSTPWNLSTASATADSKQLNVESTNHFNFHATFDDADASRLYVTNNTVTRSILQYSNNPPFELSTLTYDNKSFDPSAAETMGDVWFSKTGRTMLTVHADGSGSIEQWTLSTPFDVTTASLDVAFSTAGYYPICIAVDEENRKIYGVSYAREVREYTY